MKPSAGRISPSLVALIASLKAHQKRDFKKYVSFWGERRPRYVDLFDVVNEIVKSGCIDSEQVTVLARQKKLLHGMDVGWHSRFLYNKILESMRHFPEYSPLERELLGLLQDINFLYHKELYEDCAVRISEAKAIALKIDKQTYFMEACNYEKKIMIELGAKTRYAEWVKIQEEEQRTIEVLNRKTVLYNSYVYFNRSDNDENTVILPVLSQVEILDLKDRPAYTFIERLLIVQALRDHLVSGTRVKRPAGVPGQEPAPLQEIYRHQQALLDLFQEQPWMKTEDPVHYRNNIERLLSLGASLNDLSLFSKYLADPVFNDVEEGAYYYKTVVYLTLIKKLMRGEVAGACAYIEEKNLKKSLPLYRHKMPEARFMAILTNCVYAYFINESFAEALQLIVRIKTFEGKKEHLPAFLMSRLLEIVAKIETGFYMKNDQGSQDVSRLYRFSLEQGLLDDELRAWLKILDSAADYGPEDLPVYLAPHWKKMSASKPNALADSLYGPVYCWTKSRVEKIKMSQVLSEHLACAGSLR